MNKNIIFTEPSDADRNISSMFRYLLSKKNAPLKKLSAHTLECVRITDEATFDFFVMTFNDDLKRMGLI